MMMVSDAAEEGMTTGSLEVYIYIGGKEERKDEVPVDRVKECSEVKCVYALYHGT